MPANNYEKETMDLRAKQLESIGFKFDLDENSCWYQKGSVKMIPTLMMCASEGEWQKFIAENTDALPEPVKGMEEAAEKYAMGWIPDNDKDDHWDKKQKKNQRLEITEHFETGFKVANQQRDERIKELEGLANELRRKNKFGETN